MVVGPSRVLFLLLAFSACCGAAEKESTPKMSAYERAEMAGIYQEVVSTIRQNYYEATLNKGAFETRRLEAEKRIPRISSFNEGFGVIGWMVDSLEDSHTVFIPPPRPYAVEHGWRMQLFGEKGFITAVRHGSDAEAKGLKAGDQVLSIEGFPVARGSWQRMLYAFNTLSPRYGMKMVVASPGEQPRELLVMGEPKKLSRVMFESPGDYFGYINRVHGALEKDEWLRYAELDDVLVCKFNFWEVDNGWVDEILKRSQKFKSLIIDLRGNGGGSLDSLAHLVGGVFDHTIAIANRISRKKQKPLTAKLVNKHHFNGDIIVLVDSDSGSASELFARTLQIGKRGRVIGDRSAGAVMQARVFVKPIGLGAVTAYGIEVTDADLIMSDGGSLEHVGVIPDIPILPTPEDILAGRDPALGRAAELGGAPLSSEDAGKLFPVIWPQFKE